MHRFRFESVPVKESNRILESKNGIDRNRLRQEKELNSNRNYGELELDSTLSSILNYVCFNQLIERFERKESKSFRFRFPRSFGSNSILSRSKPISIDYGLRTAVRFY